MDFNQLKGYNWENLKKTNLGAGHSATFEEIYLILYRMSRLLLDFEVSQGFFIEYDRVKLSQIFEQLLKFTAKAESFQASDGETIQDSQTRSKQLLQAIQAFYNISIARFSELQFYLKEDYKQRFETELVSYRSQVRDSLVSSQNSLSDRINQADESVKKLNQSIDEVKDIKTNIETLNSAVQDSSLVGLVSEYGKNFRNQAVKNRNGAIVFGILFLVLISISVALLIMWFLPLVTDINLTEDGVNNVVRLEYYIFAFIIRFSVLFFLYILIREVLKNYNSNLHMYHLNSHRDNSLKSFGILVGNNKLPENRDQIVKEIAQTIFSNQDDGYLSHDKKEISISDIASLINAIRK